MQEFGQSRDYQEALKQVSKENMGVGVVLNAIGKAMTAQTERDDVIYQMQEFVLDELFNGELIAVGYRETPSVSSAPVAIDADIFDTPAIDWDTSKVSAYGKTYNRVRIAASRNDAAAIPLRPMLGRKGSAAAINAAVIALHKRHKDFCAMPRQEASKLIRAYLKVTEIRGNGLSDANLAKAILRVCPKRDIPIS